MIADDLRAEREAQGFTQTDVVDWIGCSRASISNFEGGKQDMVLSKVTAYADALGCDLRLVRR